MFSAPEAYLLLSLPNATLTVSGSNTEMGNLSLECVSLPSPDSKDAQDRNVYLVLRMNATELPIDPATTVKSSDGPGFKTYTFQGTQIHPTDVIVKVLVSSSDVELLSKLEAFENIVEQYVAEYHGSTTTAPPTIAGQSTTVDVVPGDKDLRGHLVMINEDTGEVVGEVEDRFKIKEDPLMHEKGHEHDPVIIEVPEETTRQADANVLEAFARIVPPEQRNWITSSANVVRYARPPWSLVSALLIIFLHGTLTLQKLLTECSERGVSSRGEVVSLPMQKERSIIADVYGWNDV